MSTVSPPSITEKNANSVASSVAKSVANRVASQVRKSISSTASRLRKSNGLKFKYSLYSALVFFLLASPQMFSFVQRILGSVVQIADPNGCPTHFGLILHTIVFLGVLFLMMSLPRDVA